MRIPKHILLLCSCVTSLVASQEDQAVLLTSQDDDRLPITQSKPFRVAIVGAGSAGSSAAFHISRFLNQSSLDLSSVEISIFDSNSRPGGRTTTVNAFDSASYPIELGASIFVKINHILYEAAQEFALVTNKAYHDAPKVKSGYGLGIWDGTEFVYRQTSDDDDQNPWTDWRGWWNIGKLFWRYGMAPIWTRTATNNAVTRFLKLYDEPHFPFSDLTKAVNEVELLPLTGVTGSIALAEARVGEGFQRDIIQASTRVNYAQNLGQIHGLEAMVCMAIEGAMAVEGGNWQIMNEMLKASNAKTIMESQITSIHKSEKGYSIQATSSNSESVNPESTNSIYDAIILAAPFHSTKITFSPALSYTPAPIPYVELHVTLFTSPHRLSQSFFKQPAQTDVPLTILTTLPNHSPIPPHARGPLAVGPAQFWSISTLRAIRRAGQRTQYLYKIFSPTRITATFLAELLDLTLPATEGENHSEEWSDPISALPEQDVSWVHEKVWNSYPYEIPRQAFERIRLDEHRLESDPEQQSNGGRGIWYTGGIESFVSTMETSALMGKNVARLIVDELLAAVSH